MLNILLFNKCAKFSSLSVFRNFIVKNLIGKCNKCSSCQRLRRGEFLSPCKLRDVGVSGRSQPFLCFLPAQPYGGGHGERLSACSNVLEMEVLREN